LSKDKNAKMMFFVFELIHPSPTPTHLTPRNLVSVSSMFYEQLLSVKIPKAQKRLTT